MTLTIPSNKEIIAFQEKVQKDPIWFTENVLKKSLWEKEKEILLAVRDNQEVAVRSCNSSGKTFTAARIVHWWLIGYPNSIVITTAPTGRQVREVLWREIKNAVAGLPIYKPENILETKINIDNRWFALGLSTDQPDQFQGFHSSYLLVIVDEASGVDDKIFEAIDGLKPNKILLLGNPLRNTGRFANDFKSPQVKKIVISAFDTLNVQASGYTSFEQFKNDWINNRVSIEKNTVIIPGLVALNDVIRMAQRYGIDSDVFRVRILGEFPKAEEDVLITIDEVAQAMERTVQAITEFEKVMGVDVARFGQDRTAIVVRQMEKVIRKEVITNQDLMAITGIVMNIAREEGIKAENIFIDVIGYGAGVVDRLKEQGWNVNGVNVAMSAKDSEHYANLRAELYGSYIKEWIKTGQLLKDDDFYELTNIKYSFNSRGQMVLESKEDMKKRGLNSPDVADALALTFASSSITSGQIYYPKSIGGVAPYYPDLNI